jgi:hypothetical protein
MSSLSAGQTPVEALWATRPSLVRQRDAAADLAAGSTVACGQDDPLVHTADKLCMAAWAIDERIMAEPVIGPNDLAIKAKVVRERHADELEELPLVKRLLDDVIISNLARQISEVAS